MRALLVLAHPEPTSLSASLFKEAITYLTNDGHEVRTSDLYQMGFKATVDRSDFPAMPPEKPLRVVYDSYDAYKAGNLSADILAEQEKLDWADTLILVFPIWWFGMPAMLKGWFERIYTAGYGYRTGEYTSSRWDNRYGEGRCMGKRALAVVNIGGMKEHYSPTGINGPVDDMLWPINHGTLFYTGFEVLPSFITFRSDRVDADTFKKLSADLHQRLTEIPTAQPIPYRKQNFGEYSIPALELKPELVDEKKQGYALHVKSP